MFCPRCATENDFEQEYCSQCGQPLSDVRLGLQGAPSESLAKLKSGSELMNAGIATLIVLIFIATIIAILGIVLGRPVLGAIAMMNALLGALIGLPLVIVGKSRVSEATRLLTSEAEIRILDARLRRHGITVGNESKFEQLPRVSFITEHTTRELNEQHNRR